jgi:protein-tyrosine-phosphatase
VSEDPQPGPDPGREDSDEIVLGFVCVQNAGRSQMSAAFARQERARRDLDAVDIITGGTHPAEQIHEEVLAVMQEVEIGLSDRTPRRVSTAELESCDYLVTMGCSTLELDADGAGVEVRDWGLEDPHGKRPEAVREIREEIRDRVSALFDDIEHRTVVTRSE